MDSLSKKILIAEDDENITEILKMYLENNNFQVITARDGLEALEIIRKSEIDLALFDVLMPKIDGFALIRKVRRDYKFPIIFLSAKKSDSDKILGLSLGADDYIAKPFNPLEVLARINAAFRRVNELSVPPKRVQEREELTYQNLRVNLKTLQLYKNGKEISVTPTQLRILILLMENPGRVFTKKQIMRHLNGELYEHDENTVTVHISNLRDKIEDDSRNPVFLLTVRGIGYKFAAVR
ncbi:MAG: response regulator transcription factor [Bilifractor sp.]